MNGIGQARCHAIDKGRQDQGGKVGSPALRIGIELFLVERIGAVVGIGNQLVAISSGLIVALQPAKNFEGLLGSRDRLIDDLSRIFGEYWGVESSELGASKRISD